MIFGKHFSKYYLKYLGFFLVGIAVLVTIDWFQLMIPEYTGNLLTSLDKNTATAESVNALISSILLVGCIVATGRFVWRFMIFGTSRQIEYQLRNTMFGHATKLAQEYYSHKKVGGLMTHFINDLAAIREAFGPGLLTLVDGLFLGGMTIYKMMNVNWLMTLFALVPIVLLLIVVMFVNKSMRLKFRIRQDAFEAMSDFTQESFAGISIIKAYVRELKELMFFNRKSEDFYEKNFSYVKKMVFMQICVSIIANFIIIYIISFGAYLVIYSGWEIGRLTEYIEYFFMLMWPISAITRFFYVTSQAKASGKRVGEFLDEKYSVYDKETAIEVDKISGNIKVCDLSFMYPDGETNVLENISFEIKAGENIGILGRTGSGKSSLVDLLLRVYNVRNDSIYLDGHDIMDLKINCVRNFVSYVPQDNFLFSDTITNNIAFSDSKPDSKRVLTSAELADVKENIENFQYQYETELGERGVTVSGGQKQRISIARALYKDAPILILDDSVSAVDTKTEEAIINNLHRVRAGKTTIFIAHRISTVKKMDKIILLDKGKLVAIGSHIELLETSKLYADMVRRQQLESIVEGK